MLQNKTKIIELSEINRIFIQNFGAKIKNIERTHSHTHKMQQQKENLTYNETYKKHATYNENKNEFT